jgi:DNA-binding PadR family transcriptional regulator
VRANAATSSDRLEKVRTLNHGDYHILLALENGERHAYAIMLEVDELTEGATKFGPGTLFTSISRLLMVGLIEEAQTRQDLSLNDEQRRYYRLTRSGQRVLQSESARLAEQSFHMQQVVRFL